jgi:hypothetical protein
MLRDLVQPTIGLAMPSRSKMLRQTVAAHESFLSSAHRWTGSELAQAVRANDNDCTLIAALNRASLSSGLQEPQLTPALSAPGRGEGDGRGRVRPGGEKVSK